MHGESASSNSFTCPSCRALAADRYCHSCGERRPSAGPPSLRHCLDVAADLLTNFDTKGARSLWYLVTRPGHLSAEYLRGSRVRYAKPLALFLSINVAYLLSIAWIGANTFATPLAVQMHGNDYYGAFATSEVARVLHGRGVDYATFEALFNERSNLLAKTLVFLFIPLYAALLFALFRTRRRFVIEHAVVATHFWAFLLLMLAVLVPVIAGMLMWWQSAPSAAAALAENDGAVSTCLQVVVAGYLVLMLRRVYAAHWAYAAGVAALIAWAFFHIVWLYRFVLFEIALHTVLP